MTVLEGCNYICERPRGWRAFLNGLKCPSGHEEDIAKTKPFPSTMLNSTSHSQKGSTLLAGCGLVSVSVSVLFYFTLGYSIYIVYVTNRNKITNKRRKRKKLMVLVEVCGGQRSLAFELTTATL